VFWRLPLPQGQEHSDVHPHIAIASGNIAIIAALVVGELPFEESGNGRNADFNVLTTRQLGEFPRLRWSEIADTSVLIFVMFCQRGDDQKLLIGLTLSGPSGALTPLPRLGIEIIGQPCERENSGGEDVCTRLGVAVLGRCVEKVRCRLQQSVNRFLLSAATHLPSRNPAISAECLQPRCEGGSFLLCVRVVSCVTVENLIAEFPR
jgi:hypothetical protein